jgi:thymidylate synthase
MAFIDKSYKELLLYIQNTGVFYVDPRRKGVVRTQVPFVNFTYDLQEHGFPAITTKKLAWKSVVGELLWFLRGNTNTKYLNDNKIPIWNKDAYNFYLKNGPIYNGKPVPPEELTSYDLGRIYGFQWRKFGQNPWDNTEGTDQFKNLIEHMREMPFATDHIVTAWNPSELDKMALPPCHYGFQILCYPDVDGANILFDLVWDQRSVDTFLGLPFNIASYALLMHIIAAFTGYTPKYLRGSLRNVHLYNNSYEGVAEQVSRDTEKYGECKLKISPQANMAFAGYDEGWNDLDSVLNSLEISDFTLEGYESYPPIRVEMLARTKD